MKKLMSYALIALFTSATLSVAAPDRDAIMSKEKAAWQAFKDKKGDDFKKVVQADFRGVYADGISTMQDEMSDMQKWDMKSFSINDFNATSIDPDTVVTTYKVMINGTCEGKDLSGTYNAGSVWKKMNGEWMAIFHTNTKAEEGTMKKAG